MNASSAALRYQPNPPASHPGIVPQEMEGMIEAAFRRAEALAASGRELHFEVGAGGALRVELRDLDGCPREIVSPAQAAIMMSGLGCV
jgi:hypothetical protein